VCGSQYDGLIATKSKSQQAQEQTAVDSFNLGNISLRTMLLIVFAIKEGCIVTAVVCWGLMRLLSGVLYLVVGLILSPYLWHLYNNEEDHRGRRQLRYIFDMVDGIVLDQLDILWRLCINLSTSYRIYGLLSALAHRLVNASIKDLDTKLTSVANLLYTLMLIFVRGGTPDATLVSATALSLFTLLHKMNGESILLSSLAKGFQDLNENRLNKFEFALFLVKTMERFLSSDVQYTWVEHMVGEPDFTPDVHDDDFVHPAATKGEPRDYIKQPRFLVSDVSRGLEDSSLVEKNRKEAIRAEHYRELMPLSHAEKFGHDGLGQFRLKYAKDPEKHRETFTVTKDSLVFTHGSGAAKSMEVTPALQLPPQMPSFPQPPPEPAASTLESGGEDSPGGAVFGTLDANRIMGIQSMTGSQTKDESGGPSVEYVNRAGQAEDVEDDKRYVV